MSGERSTRTRVQLPYWLHGSVQTALLLALTLTVLAPLLIMFVATFQDGNDVIRR